MLTRQTAQDASSASALPNFDRAGFVEAFGNSFRNGAILAGRAFDGATAPLEDAEGIFAALRAQFQAASNAERLEILKAYTPLNPGIKATQLVADEQLSSGLRAMTAGQQARLLDLLSRYVQKFGFDAIFVVRNYTTASLLDALETRILDNHETELRTTFGEVELLAEIHVKAHFS